MGRPYDRAKLDTSSYGRAKLDTSSSSSFVPQTPGEKVAISLSTKPHDAKILRFHRRQTAIFSSKTAIIPRQSCISAPFYVALPSKSA